MDYPKKFDCIVVGGGHAGTEAALAASRMGAETLLLTQNLETLGQMSCNPAIGGIGKGHLAKEVDALDGAMGRAIDRAGIHFRILNASKGPAVRATRVQADRVLYKLAIRHQLETQPKLSLLQQGVDDLILNGDRVEGVVSQMGLRITAPTVVLTVGTFLAGKIHVGDTNYSAGRAGDQAAIKLAEQLRALGLRVSRLKTGTPPRIDGASIDYTQLQPQPGDEETPVFSFIGRRSEHPRQVPCHIAHTNEVTHEIIRAGLARSPLFSGVIEGVGPRYCPSIEDKVVRFSERTSHQIFVEPEGLDTKEIYPNGISTSLPFDIQQSFVQSIKGFEKAHITRPGYAIEYDFFDPRDLQPSLETKEIKGLYFAGQINGTTGYEEAAAQGIVAGINAGRAIHGETAWITGRDESYIGVLIDDLVTRGTLEPYRMFTSRAEYRLSLREDNADLRLTPKGRELGVVGDIRWNSFQAKAKLLSAEKCRLSSILVRPIDVPKESPIGTLSRDTKAHDLLRRSNVSYKQLVGLSRVGYMDNHLGLDQEQVEQVGRQIEIEARYTGYIKRQKQEIKRQRKFDTMMLPLEINYSEVKGLSNEAREKLEQIRPKSLGQASRIAGMTPAAISLLLVYLKKNNFKRIA